MPATKDEEDPYAHFAKGTLKLKSDQTVSKKKKNKDGKKKKLVEVSKIIEEEKSEKVEEVIRTKAELAFQKMQEKMVSKLKGSNRKPPRLINNEWRNLIDI
ncbi:protein fam32a [Lasius niger]|uniref:Protein fam32a n=1 Tax=Lasius niger TaxID=67767 RepID=A0A0J7L605_LASNI|nr:protein fam32a [Lasius niger]